MMKTYRPLEVAQKMRPKMIDLANKKVLLADFRGTGQAKDFSNRHLIGNWGRKYLELKPKEKNLPSVWQVRNQIASRNLNIPVDECNASFVIQVKGCDLACWFCYTDDVNKDGCSETGVWVSAEEILMKFLAESHRCRHDSSPDEKINIIRISGGEISIVPELIFWLIEAIEKYGLEDRIYLWSDTNLTTLDAFWGRFDGFDKIRSFRNFGIVGCYKGIDEESYAENTGADPDTWIDQFSSHRFLINAGLDVYSYLVPTVQSESDQDGRSLEDRMRRFIRKMRDIVDPLAPLRLFPLEICVYNPMKPRLNAEREESLTLQHRVRSLLQKMVAEMYGREAKRNFQDIPVKSRIDVTV